MRDAQVREKLARISSRPPAEWPKRLEQEFPTDPAMRVQALLWMHSDKDGLEMEGAPPSLGEDADQRYDLTVRIDASANASVWQAYDRRLGRNVAIKVFHGHSESIDQVLAEARAASDVVSEHVVRVLDVQYGDGNPYIVMELVSEYEAERGEVVLGDTAAATRPRDIEEVARWVMQVARGVQEAHLRNVFHRDLKPRNVLITPNSRRARVADFGLAVSGASPDGLHPSTTSLKRGSSGPVSVRGTPEYMAPRQARGLPLMLDARVPEDRALLVSIDVWGLGTIAYELLSGRPPWLARRSDDLSAWEIAASSERPPPLVRTRDGERIPTRLRRVIEKAMAPDPSQRYPSAASMANELQAYLSRRPTSLDRSRALRIVLWSRRNPQLALFGLVAVVLTTLAVGTHLTLTRMRGERDALDREVEAQKHQRATLKASVDVARQELGETRTNLAMEQENLAALEKSLGDERASYQALSEAKEQALQNATASTRKIMDQLEASQRERRALEQMRAAQESKMEVLRRERERAAKERDHFRRERESARAERDTVQRERDAAIADREVIEKQLDQLKAALGEPARSRSQRK